METMMELYPTPRLQHCHRAEARNLQGRYHVEDMGGFGLSTLTPELRKFYKSPLVVLGKMLSYGGLLHTMVLTLSPLPQ